MTELAAATTEDGYEIDADGKVIIPIEVDDETYAFYAAMVDGAIYRTAEEAMSAVVETHLRALIADRKAATQGPADAAEKPA